MSTSPTNPASAPKNQNTQIIIPLGADASGSIEMARIYIDGGITKEAVVKLRNYFETLAQSLT